MKFLVVFALLCLPTLASATITAEQEFAINRLNSVARKHSLGTLLQKKVNVVVGKYSFAVQGGGTGTYNLRSDLADANSLVKIPAGAVIKQVWIDVLTPGTTSASGTMALNLQSAGDLKGALAAASYTGIVAGIPVGVAANMIKLTAERTLTATIATGALTAGRWNVYIEYVLGD
jgi:hypothetical protein